LCQLGERTTGSTDAEIVCTVRGKTGTAVRDAQCASYCTRVVQWQCAPSSFSTSSTSAQHHVVCNTVRSQDEVVGAVSLDRVSLDVYVQSQRAFAETNTSSLSCCTNECTNECLG